MLSKSPVSERSLPKKLHGQIGNLLIMSCKESFLTFSKCAPDTTQVCRLGSASAGTYPVMVSFPSLGYSRYAEGNILNFTYQLIITSFSPSSGSIAGKMFICNCKTRIVKKIQICTNITVLDNKTAVCFVLYIGGTLITVRGFGFSEDTTVTIGSNECKVVHGNDTELNCRTPAVSALTGNDPLL